MPGVCLNIYHILVLVRLGERNVFRETLFNLVHRVPLGGSVWLHLRRGLLTVPPLHQVASLPGHLVEAQRPRASPLPGFPPDGAASQAGPSNFGSLLGTERMWWVKRDGVVSKFSSIFRSRSARGSTT